MANVSWSTSIQIAGGPTVTATQGPFAAEATERIEVSIPSSTAPSAVTTVDLQPGPIESIHLLLIKASSYGDGTNLTFKTSGGSTEATPIFLKGPQFYSGGAVNLLGAELNKLDFSNTTGSDIQIEIFVARDATPTPS